MNQYQDAVYSNHIHINDTFRAVGIGIIGMYKVMRNSLFKIIREYKNTGHIDDDSIARLRNEKTKKNNILYICLVFLIFTISLTWYMLGVFSDHLIISLMYDTENYQGVFGVYEDYSQSQIDVYSLKSGYIAADIYYMISECEQEMIDCIKNDRAFDEKRIDVSDNTVRLMNDLKAQGLQINEEKIEDCNKAAQNYIRYISGKIYNHVQGNFAVLLKLYYRVSPIINICVFLLIFLIIIRMKQHGISLKAKKRVFTWMWLFVAFGSCIIGFFLPHVVAAYVYRTFVIIRVVWCLPIIVVNALFALIVHLVYSQYMRNVELY